MTIKISSLVLNYGGTLVITSSAVLVYAYYFSPSEDEKRKTLLKDPNVSTKAASDRKEFQDFFNKMKSQNDKEQQEKFEST